MPTRRKSPGSRYFVTPFASEFQRYIWYELVNAMHFNPDAIKHIQQEPCRWEFKTVIWSIRFDGANIVVTSDESEVQVRKGLSFDMGNGRIVIEGT